ncbi:MAG TPA: sigma-70 family RNA polymerase sigma factor [Burkholderiaceae bacterium]|nr:sigma-70 family RNA polymerase sigma factor [Burkholderiaceae bacterium]
MKEQNNTARFEAIALPHLDAAYNLARWLTRNDHSADDLVQTAYMRAFSFFDGFRGGDARAWILTIVRNAYFSSLRENRNEKEDVSFDEGVYDRICNDRNASAYDISNSPENAMADGDVKRMVNQALGSLPQQFREVLVLKEIQDLSYKEIAEIVDIPMGTVMSRLSRGRDMLRDYLKKHAVGV